jgi:putative ABC transport system permease protein
MLLDIAFKALWRRKLRSLLTVLGVAAAVQLYLMMTGILAFYDWDIQRQVSAFAGKVFVQRPVHGVGAGEDFPSMNSSIAAGTAGEILALEGIDRTASSGVLFIPLVADVRPNMPPLYFVVGLEPGSEAAFLGGLEIRSGTAELGDARGVILGSSAADHYRPAGSASPAGPGDVIRVMDEEFTVIGVLGYASTLYNGTVTMPLTTAQDLFHRPATVSAVILTASRTDNIDKIKTAVAAQYPALQASNQEDIARNAADMMSMQRTFFALINNSAMLSTVLIVMIVVLVAVMEQRKDIGTLRAVGARQWRIFGMVAGESLVLVLAGGLLSFPASFVFGKIFGYGAFFSIWETIRLWLGTLGLCLLIGLLASLLPAWQAVRVDPLEALRSE